MCKAIVISTGIFNTCKAFNNACTFVCWGGGRGSYSFSRQQCEWLGQCIDLARVAQDIKISCRGVAWVSGPTGPSPLVCPQPETFWGQGPCCACLFPAARPGRTGLWMPATDLEKEQLWTALFPEAWKVPTVQHFTALEQDLWSTLGPRWCSCQNSALGFHVEVSSFLLPVCFNKYFEQRSLGQLVLNH